MGFRDFGSCESEVRQYVAARVWASVEGPRALFDRARVHMLRERILLPGMTVLVRLVGEVRRAENERLHALLSGGCRPRCAPRWWGCWRCRTASAARSWSGCRRRRPRPRAG
ncbi:DUF4158 domain-containing protein [Nonomuraea indica]|uniref:DUF4158 domain-containing protein n=1 Tax=Nonomuraea indica TaxID=1581193 RepID=A0ABW8ADT6_9ACTN